MKNAKPDQTGSLEKMEPKTRRHHEPERRRFLTTLGLALIAAVPLKVIAANEARRPRLTRPRPVDEEWLKSACIRCGECFRVCPERRIHAVYFESGIEGYWTPRRVGSCENYHCHACADACPTGAMRA